MSVIGAAPALGAATVGLGAAAEAAASGGLVGLVSLGFVAEVPSGPALATAAGAPWAAGVGVAVAAGPAQAASAAAPSASVMPPNRRRREIGPCRARADIVHLPFLILHFDGGATPSRD